MSIVNGGSALNSPSGDSVRTCFSDISATNFNVADTSNMGMSGAGPGGGVGFAPEVEAIVSQLERGTVVTKFFFRKRPEKRSLSIRRETRQLIWQRSSAAGRNVYEGAVDIHEIKEVRVGKTSKDFEKWPDDAKRHDTNKCFVIFYGNEFRLRTLSAAALSERESELWVKGLNFLVNDTMQAPYPLQLDIWLRKEFNGLESNRGNITLKDLKVFLPKINCKMATGKLRDLFQSIDTQKVGHLGFDEFSNLFHQLLHQQEIFHLFLGNYSADTETVSMKEFQAFLEQEQNELLSNDEVSKFLQDYLQNPEREAQPYLTVVEFVDFLFSSKNEIWNSKYSEVTDDMTRPLSHYWIASSHNTYLTGDQFSSESSVEAYARCLLQGCRCIELDTWDGPDGLPFIFHGHTLTTKIKFLDVLKCIKEHAFLTSDYPLILSVEDHCTLGQQRKMAEKFKEILGDTLVTQNLDKNESQLPSPEQLKKRIILKHKKLPDGVDEGSFVSKNDDFSKEMDLSNTIKNGILYLEDTESQTWNPHFFVLTQNKLLYTEMTSQAEQNDEAEDDDESVIDDKGNNPADKLPDRNDELHFSEKWFHGRLRGGRVAGNELIEKYRHLGDGTFLVRESDTFVGDYTLSFWRRGRVNHCHIHSKYEWGQVKYFLVDSLTFDSLYSLITHYRSNPIRGLEFHVVLNEPVPQPQSHEDCPWYHGSIDRAQAEDKLRRIPHDGAFLVRLAHHGDSRFAISFRADRRIKHCIIKEDGRLFTVGLNKYETLVDLVNFYEKHPFYNRVCLKLPVSEELIQKLGVNPLDEDGIYSHPDYLDTNVFNRTTLRCKALYNYTARREDELTFTKNTIINNVLQEHPDWWVGDTPDQKQGWFPVNHIQVIEPSDDEDDSEDIVDSTPLGSLQKGAIEMMGAYVELVRNEIDSALPYILKIYVDSASLTFLVGVRSDQEAKEWFDAIKDTAQSASDRENQNKRIERQNRIAKELSSLIIYCCSVNKFSLERIKSKGRIFFEMYSFPETVAEKFMCQLESKLFMWYHQVQFSRVYPKGQRLDSSNYNPMPLWNAGCQMVALNYQTPDKAMQLNQGKFRQNGKCGYVLRPDFMFNDDFDPSSKAWRSASNIESIILCINIIGARHLSKSGRGIVSPFVEVEILGSDYEGTCTTNKTKTIQDNGFNPCWNELFEFEVQIPQLAMIRFVVQDEDMFGDPNFIGQASYPVQCLRQGYRSVPLQSGFSEDLELASLLVHLSIRSAREEVEEIIRLRDILPRLSKEISRNEEVGDIARAESVRSEFRKTQDQIISIIEGKRFRNRSKSYMGMSSLIANISTITGKATGINTTPTVQPRKVQTARSFPLDSSGASSPKSPNPRNSSCKK